MLRTPDFTIVLLLLLIPGKTFFFQTFPYICDTCDNLFFGFIHLDLIGPDQGEVEVIAVLKVENIEVFFSIRRDQTGGEKCSPAPFV